MFTQISHLKASKPLDRYHLTWYAYIRIQAGRRGAEERETDGKGEIRNRATEG